MYDTAGNEMKLDNIFLAEKNAMGGDVTETAPKVSAKEALWTNEKYARAS